MTNDSMNTNAGNLKKGDFIRHHSEIWQVQKADFYSPGKGSALMKTRIKNLMTGKNIDITYKSNEKADLINVESIEMQYLYKDQKNLYFMNERTYNQYLVPRNVIGDVSNFLQEGKKYFVYLHNDNPLTIRPPMGVKLKVVKTEQAIKGDRVTGAKKPAELETGVVIQVPLFVKVGDIVAVNPETGEYIERVKL